MQGSWKLLFSTDIHGSTSVWRKWLKLTASEQVDYGVLSGDLSGKIVVPIVEVGTARFEATYWGKCLRADSIMEATSIRNKLSEGGAYGFICSGDRFEELQNAPGEVNKLIASEISARLSDWLTELREICRSQRRRYFIAPGNDDDLYVDDVLASFASDQIIPCIENVTSIGGLPMLNVCAVNPTPWNTPREISEEELSMRIRSLLSSIPDAGRAIFNIHCPPYNTRLDEAPELDNNLKPKIVAGRVKLGHVGSKAIRSLIEEFQPPLSLHGHVHESGGVQKLGKTICINPGSEYSEGVFHGYVIEFNREDVIGYRKVEW